jgi:hypothetical protein
MYTREDYARAFLLGIKAPRSDRNLWALLAWMQAEGGNARFNPLNTTKLMPGSSDYNWVPVQNYTSFEQGVEAAVLTLNYGADRDILGYRPIRRRLRKDAWARNTLWAVEASAWGTGGLAVKCLPQVKKYFEHYCNIQIAQ